jgi:hypothetical protein
MKQLALTPVERGVLIILMVFGRPMRQAEFKTQHGLTVKKSHRCKLSELGLIDVSKDFSFSLTSAGWAWIKSELSAPRPKGLLGLGPLYAALNALNHLAARLDLPLEAALGSNGVEHARPAGAVCDSNFAWSDVDEPLARALQDIPVFTASVSRLKDASPTLEKDIKRIEMSANLVLQSVRLAAAKRQLNQDGKIGTEIAYDPVLFHSDDLVKLGDPVRIRKSAITRGHGKAKVIIQPGIAEALPHSK